eukprot:8092468-Pyramimonas_sp.AAC.1
MQIDQLLSIPCPGEGTTARLDATVAQARSLLGRRPAGDSSSWQREAAEFLESWEGDLQEAVQVVNKPQQDSWDEWQEKALEG